MRLRLGLLLTLWCLALPASALALAGGSTGGGGGGGGGSSGGGFSSSGRGVECGDGGCSGGLTWYIVVACGFLLFGLVMLGVKVAGRRAARRKESVEGAAYAASHSDGSWAPARLNLRVRECFFPVQQSWEDRNVEKSRPYVSDALFERHKLQLEGLEKQGRVNRITDLKLSRVELVSMHNVSDDGDDRFVAHIWCSARDWMEDVETGDLINGSTELSDFEQYWSFARHPEHGWVLDEIQQGTEGGYHREREIVNEEPPPVAS